MNLFALVNRFGSRLGRITTLRLRSLNLVIYIPRQDKNLSIPALEIELAFVRMMTPTSNVSPSGDDPSTLRGRQLSALRQMLRLNGESSTSSTPSASSSSSSSSPQWKILLFDRLGQDLLSPVLNVKALRDEGVTLHLLINTER